MSADWSGGGPDGYAAAGDAWAHAADEVTRIALARLGRLGGLSRGAEGPEGPEGLNGPGRSDRLDGLDEPGWRYEPSWSHHPGGPGGPGGPDGPAPRVLDVGTGSGPAALAAARAGARVVGLDRAADLLRTARERAAGAGVAGRTRFVVGDAGALPFPRASFDVALSTFGVMFAPDPWRAAAELVRVCGPGGLLAVASWTPDGALGRIAPTVTSRLPVPPPAVTAPTRWGEPERVRRWFAPLPVTVETVVREVRVEYPSVDEAVRVFARKPGPLRTYRAALEAAGRWDAARSSLTDLFAGENRAVDGRLVMDVPYLLVLGRVRAG
ncbi:class I SAM-dependent methyltransferase [Streptomyces sp. JNUCC 64]